MSRYFADASGTEKDDARGENPFDDGEDTRMIVCETCGGDGSFDRVVGHDPSGPVWEDSFCPACQGAGEYAVKTKPAALDDISE